MSDLVDEHGRPRTKFVVGLPGPADDEQWKNELAAWADQLGKIPGMTRAQIYEMFGKATRKATWAYRGGCDCDTECDCPPPKRRRIHVWTHGVRPHANIRVLRHRAREEHLRRIPGRPYRYMGAELRRPPSVRCMDGV